MTKILARVAIDIAVILFIIHGWWYFAILLCVVGIWNFGFYFECIIAGLLYDSLFGSQVAGIIGYIGLIVSSSVYLIMFTIKKIVRIKE